MTIPMTIRNRRFLLPALAVCCAVPLAWSGPPSAETPAATDLTVTGSIVAWAMAADGDVFLQVREPATTKAVWFVTPPNQTNSTDFEEMVLQAVLELRATSDRPAGATAAIVTVRGDVSNEVSGATMAEAVPLLSLRQE